jgi:aspartate/tyrosine/aromatic aminotransferase
MYLWYWDDIEVRQNITVTRQSKKNNIEAVLSTTGVRVQQYRWCSTEENSIDTIKEENSIDTIKEEDSIDTVQKKAVSIQYRREQYRVQ